MTLPCLLVVDDEPLNLTVLADLFKDEMRVLVAKDGEQALKRAAGTPRPDLILLDVMMPGMDGYEVCRRLKAMPEARDIPVIFVTALSEARDESAGLEAGAIDYITKPIYPPVVRARVQAHLALVDQTRTLERLVAERTRELALTRDLTIHALASLAETRDNETGNHIRRTQHYMRLLAEHLRGHPRFAAELTDAAIDLLFKSAPLHDIGKVGIPDAILLKPGKLTEDEFLVMKCHPEIGRDALLAAEELMPSNSFLRTARDIAYCHHEKWDGSGYPRGLAGEAIPLAGRLMAVADVYDALICRRVYKPAFTYEEAANLILAGRGGHFDPDIVDAFLVLRPQFEAVADQFADH